MKKLFLLTLVLTAFASSTFAQSTGNIDPNIEAAFRKYRFGLYVGPTFNTLKPVVGRVEDSKSGNYFVQSDGGRTSFNVGLDIALNITEKYAIYTGIGMHWNGGNLSAYYDSTGVPVAPLSDKYARSADIDFKNQYLSIPLGLKLYAASIDDLRIYVQTGLDVSLLLSQKGDYSLIKKDGTPIAGTGEKLGPYATTTPINVGWQIGAGAEYGLSNGSAAFLTVLYRNGFTDYTSPKSNDDGNKFVDGNIRSNTIAVRIGYIF